MSSPLPVRACTSFCCWMISLMRRKYSRTLAFSDARRLARSSLSNSSRSAAKVLLQSALVFQGAGELVLFDQIDRPFELEVHFPLLRLLDRLFQQRGAARIDAAAEFAHPQQQVLQPLEAIGDLLLLDGELFRRARLDLRLRFVAACGGGEDRRRSRKRKRTLPNL